MNRKFNHYWPVYKNLEEEIIQLSKYIQFTDDQLGIYSLHISDLLVRCSVEIEAIAKELYWENGGVKLYYSNGQEREPYFDTDCITYLESKWKICQKVIIISSNKFYLEKDENREISPLHNAHERGKAEWKKAYQAIKHNRKKELRKGNIKNLLHAMGALYILNLYYSNERIELDKSNISNQSFDNRMGSEIFAASFSDATVNICLSSEMKDDDLPSELVSKINQSIYIIKFEEKSLDFYQDVSSKLRDKMWDDLQHSDKWHKYFADYQNDFNKLENKNIDFLVYTIFGADYLSKVISRSELLSAIKQLRSEVVINKNQKIYG